MEKSIALTEEKKQEIYASIYDDSMWLVDLTENLLSITRIENGTMHLQMNAELIDDVLREAIAHVDRQAARHHIRVNLEDDLLMAKMDARLIVQVIINIVNNAIKYTRRGPTSAFPLKKKTEWYASTLQMMDRAFRMRQRCICSTCSTPPELEKPTAGEGWALGLVCVSPL